MRLARVLVQDIRYQMKYGFYLLYALISLIYIGFLRLLPLIVRADIAALIILSDPVLFGFFFIGGIYLLEQGEGLHRYWSILPTKPQEYIIAKLISLALISTISGLLIVGFSGMEKANYPLLAVALFLVAGIFTLTGLSLATLARTLNHYLVIAISVEISFLLPPLLLLCGLNWPFLLILPGAQGLAVFRSALGLGEMMDSGVLLIGLFFWLMVAFVWAYVRVPGALREGGNGN
ncbi:MAG: ABC transporter [Firmicutes bacterium]|nr:ABC transporter [Bacillota bacterium]